MTDGSHFALLVIDVQQDLFGKPTLSTSPPAYSILYSI